MRCHLRKQSKTNTTLLIVLSARPGRAVPRRGIDKRPPLNDGIACCDGTEGVRRLCDVPVGQHDKIDFIVSMSVPVGMLR